MNKQVSDAKIFGIQGFCKVCGIDLGLTWQHSSFQDLLEVADVLNKAVTAVPSEALQESQYLKDMHQGLQLTESQLLKVGVQMHFRNHNICVSKTGLRKARAGAGKPYWWKVWPKQTWRTFPGLFNLFEIFCREASMTFLRFRHLTRSLTLCWTSRRWNYHQTRIFHRICQFSNRICLWSSLYLSMIKSVLVKYQLCIFQLSNMY